MAADLKLGLNTGYWGAGPPPGVEDAIAEADRLGFDSVWTAEAYGSDVLTPLAWWGSKTQNVRLGTAIMQMSARQPAAAAMAAITMDHLTGGRFILGLGVSGPQVVEGWYGQPSNRPLARTREYVDIIRRALRREGPLANDGEFYPLPYRGEGSQGLGKPLKIMTHPLRADIPIFLGAEGPKNVTQTAEIADGWLPLYYSPFRQDVYADQLKDAKPGFEINAMANVTVTDDVAAALLPVKGMLGFYIGGMGAKGQNFHTKLMQRMGFEEEALKIQELFFAGKRDEAIMSVPDEFADEISIVGPPSRIKERLEAWRDSPVTTLMVAGRDPEQLEVVRDLVLG
jgi:F420-dependent oxidoreductase-like protein